MDGINHRKHQNEVAEKAERIGNENATDQELCFAGRAAQQSNESQN